MVIGRLIPVRTGFKDDDEVEEVKEPVAVGAETDAQAGLSSSDPDQQIDEKE